MLFEGKPSGAARQQCLDARLVCKHRVHRIQHRRSAAKGLAERLRFQPILALMRPFMQNVVKQTRLGLPPEVDGLLRISDGVEAAPAGVILHHLIHQAAHDIPLHPAGVLKLIKEPMVITSVEPKPEITAFTIRPFLAILGRRCEQTLHVGKGQPSTRTDAAGILGLIQRHERRHAPGTLRTAEQFLV